MKIKKLTLVIFIYFSILTLSYCFYELENMRCEHNEKLEINKHFITYKDTTHEQKEN
jgi:hypothetical protein